jgi:uncharacterized protein (TIGR02285 family)
MGSFIKNGLCALALLIVFAQPAWPESIEITWTLEEWPPFNMLRNGKIASNPQELGDGAIDHMLLEIIKRMPGYHHIFQLSNLQRVRHGMEQGENLCTASAIKTPARLKHSYFTPEFLGTPMALVVHQTRKDAILGDANPVSLAKVIAQHGEEGRFQYLRAYGPQVDAVIEKSPVEVKRERVPASGFLLKPLSQGLYGFTLEYPAVVEYARRRGNLTGPLLTVPIEEAPDWIVGYVACTRNDWGRHVIEDIDRAIRQASADPNYYDAMEKWLPAEYSKGFLPKMRDFYVQRNRGPAQIE